MRRPAVTVAMAAYNAAETVGQAVRSVLWQSFEDWELLIGEDGSSDNTSSVLSQFDDPRISVFSDGSNRGKPVRMNQLIKRARAPLLAVMDADDVSFPDRLGAQVAFLERHPEVDLLATGMATFDHEGRLGRWRRLRQTHRDIVRRPWLGFHFNSPTWMGRTEWFARHGYREDLRAAEDEDLLLRAYATSRFSSLEDLLLAYRIDQWTWSKAKRMRGDHVRALTAALRETGDPRYAAGVLVQGAKLLREGVAVALGVEDRLLSHRALPLDAETARRVFEVLTRIEED